MLGPLTKLSMIPGAGKSEPGFYEEVREFFLAGYKNGVEVIDDTRILTSCSYGAQYLARLGACVSRALSPLADLSALGGALSQVDLFVDSTRIIDDVEYFLFSKSLMDDLKNGVWSWIGLRACFTVADVTSTISFADSINVIDSVGIASKLASVTVLGCSIFCPITSLALGTVGLTMATLGYLCLAVDCAIRIHRGEDSRLTMILAARAAIEIFYKLFKLSGAAAIAGTAVTGVVGASAAMLAVAAVYEQLTGPGRPPMPQPQAEHWIKRWIWV